VPRSAQRYVSASAEIAQYFNLCLSVDSLYGGFAALTAPLHLDLQAAHYGLTAQDVERLLPDLVKDTRFEPARAVSSSETADLQNSEAMNFKALNYTELIPILIKAIQDQQQEIEESRRLVGSRN